MLKRLIHQCCNYQTRMSAKAGINGIQFLPLLRSICFRSGHIMARKRGMIMFQFILVQACGYLVNPTLYVQSCYYCIQQCKSHSGKTIIIEQTKLELIYSSEIRNIVLNIGHCSSPRLVNILCFAMWLFVLMEQSHNTLHQGNKFISLHQFRTNILPGFSANSLYILH